MQAGDHLPELREEASLLKLFYRPKEIELIHTFCFECTYTELRNSIQAHDIPAIKITRSGNRQSLTGSQSNPRLLTILIHPYQQLPT